MTTNQPDRLDRIESTLEKLVTKVDELNKDVRQTNTRLGSLFNGLVTALVSTVIAASLLILARNGVELWLQLR